MKKREADFGTTFRHWLRANPRFSCAFELKQTSKPRILFSCIEPHQIEYLQAIKSNKGTLIRVQGTNGEPDYIYLRNFPANIVLKFPKAFHLIDIDTFLLARQRGIKKKQKSLTSSEAEEISIVSVKL